MYPPHSDIFYLRVLAESCDDSPKLVNGSHLRYVFSVACDWNLICSSLFLCVRTASVVIS
jgi:hypothetical protein